MVFLRHLLFHGYLRRFLMLRCYSHPHRGVLFLEAGASSSSVPDWHAASSLYA